MFNASFRKFSILNPDQKMARAILMSYYIMTLISSDTRQRDTRVDVIGAGTFLTSLDHLIIWSTSKAPASLGLHSFWVWGLPWDGHEMVMRWWELKLNSSIDLAVGQLSQTIAVLTCHTTECTFLHGWWMTEIVHFNFTFCRGSTTSLDRCCTIGKQAATSARAVRWITCVSFGPVATTFRLWENQLRLAE